MLASLITEENKGYAKHVASYAELDFAKKTSCKAVIEQVKRLRAPLGLGIKIEHGGTVLRSP
ncbi:hypothetical protein FRC12_013181 [Ceratobasidium sp. 428]|nr:hypothetical protein FRC12_013181 [Ceratobasidium sp. 428]